MNIYIEKGVARTTYSQVTLRKWRARAGKDSRSSPPVGSGALLENNLRASGLFAEIKSCLSMGVAFVLGFSLGASLLASLESGRSPRPHPFFLIFSVGIPESFERYGLCIKD